METEDSVGISIIELKGNFVWLLLPVDNILYPNYPKQKFSFDGGNITADLVINPLFSARSPNGYEQNSGRLSYRVEMTLVEKNQPTTCSINQADISLEPFSFEETFPSIQTTQHKTYKHEDGYTYSKVFKARDVPLSNYKVKLTVRFDPSCKVNGFEYTFDSHMILSLSRLPRWKSIFYAT